MVAAEVGEARRRRRRRRRPGPSPGRGWRPPSRRPPRRARRITANSACRSGASGVVSAVFTSTPGDRGCRRCRRPRRGRRPPCRPPSASRVVVVLPWVPVTPTIRSAAARVAVDARGEPAEHRARVGRRRAPARRRRRRAAAPVGVGEDRHRAAADRVGGERRAVGAGARQRGVQVAGPDPLRAQRDSPVTTTPSRSPPHGSTPPPSPAARSARSSSGVCGGCAGGSQRVVGSGTRRGSGHRGVAAHHSMGSVGGVRAGRRHGVLLQRRSS